jgi:hypothetical protein
MDAGPELQFEPVGWPQPLFGWILPSFEDRIVNDVRAGFSFEAICARQTCDAEVAAAAIARARAHDFLTEDEATFRGVCREAAACA